MKITNSNSLEVYSTDASNLKGKAKKIFLPSNISEIRNIVKKYKNIVPRGAGTGLAGGSIPIDGIVIDLSKLDKIIIDKNEIRVQAGTVVADLNAFLLKYKKFFPVMPSSGNVCTIGGLIATNAAGIRAVKYGKAEKWVKEIKIVNAEGNIQILNGKKINDFCGSEGILGIIVEAGLKTTCLPRRSSASICSFENILAVIDRTNILKGKRNLISLEYINPYASKIIGMPYKHYLISEFDGIGGDIRNDEKIYEILKIRENIGPQVSKEGYIVYEDPYLPKNKIGEFLRWVQDRKIPCFGHIGIGIFHPRFKPKQKKLANKMFGLIQKLGGKISGEHGIGITKKPYLSCKEKIRFKKLKKKYDPKNIFNPKKII